MWPAGRTSQETPHHLDIEGGRDGPEREVESARLGLTQVPGEAFQTIGQVSSPGPDPGARVGLGGGGCGDAGTGLDSDGRSSSATSGASLAGSGPTAGPDGKRAASVGGEGEGAGHRGPLGMPTWVLTPFLFLLEYLANSAPHSKLLQLVGGGGGGAGRGGAGGCRFAAIPSEPF